MARIRWGRLAAFVVLVFLSSPLLAATEELVRGDPGPPWNASWSNGLVSYWQTDAGMPSNAFLSVSFDPVGKVLYAGTWSSGLVGLNLSSLQIVLRTQATGLPSNHVAAVQVDAQSRRLFLGSEVGLALLRLDTGEIRRVCADRILRVWDLHVPPGSSKVYAGTLQGLLICEFATGVSVLVNSTTGLPRDNVVAVYADPSRGRVYAGVYPGLSIYFEADGTVINLDASNGLISPWVEKVAADDRGTTVFIAASAEYPVYTGGLTMMRADTFQMTSISPADGISYPYTRPEGLSHDPKTATLYLAVRPGVPTSPSFPINSVVDIVNLTDYSVGHITVNDGLPGGIIWDMAYDATSRLIAMAAEESFGELTGYVGGGLVLVDSSAPKVNDNTPRIAERTMPIPVNITAVDLDSIASVEARYRDIAGIEGVARLAQTAADFFEGNIPSQATEGIVSYRVTVTDSQGHVMVIPSFFEWLTIAVEDGLPPTVITFGPQGSGVPLDTEIVLSFSEPMNLTSVAAAVSISPRVAMGSPVSANATVRIPVTGLGYNTTYHVAIGGTAQDVYGNSLDGDRDGSPGGDVRWSFTTIERPTPPIVAVSAPSEVEVGKPIAIQAVVEDEDGVVRVNVAYEDVHGELLEVSMSLSGSTGPRQLWLAEVPSQDAPGSVRFRVTAQDSKGAIAVYPSEGTLSIRVVPPAGGGLPSYVLWIGTFGLAGVLAGLAYLRIRKRESQR